jgi:DNA-binding SARP family transcriptional activator
VAIWCFGGFRMTIGDLAIDWMKVRPRARAAMRLLTMRAGRPVHREALIEALWPDVPAESATANLHVALSSLRSLLEPDRDRRKPRLVVRAGDAYLLNLPSDAYLDTLAFQTALTRGRQAKATGDTTTAMQGLRDALAEYNGELLPEDGPAEWLQQERETFRRQAANAAAELAAAELQAGNSQEAVAAAEKCLVIDRFHDTGWHLLLRAYHHIGAPAAAERARRRYAATLASLGLDTDEPTAGVTTASSTTSGGEPRYSDSTPTERSRFIDHERC